MLHNVHTVVNTTKENRLVAQRNTGVSKTCTCGSRCRGNLLGVVKVGIEPYRMVLLQHVDKILSNTLRTYNWSTATYTDDLYVRYRP